MQCLDEVLGWVNERERATISGGGGATPAPTVDELLDYPSRRLAAYGTLRPGRQNHGHVQHLGGSWVRGTVAGGLVQLASGYPALRPSLRGTVEVECLSAPDLAGAWPRLDAFEGEAYRRILVAVTLADGRRWAAFAYVDPTDP